MPDIPGALLLAARLALLNLGIIKGNDWGWTSPRVLGSFLLAAVLARRCSCGARCVTVRRSSTRR